MVAASLEADWNDKLRVLEDAQQDYERQCQIDRRALDTQQRHRILALATDFRSFWQDPQTPDRERKRMIRLLIEDVTLIKQQDLIVQIRFRGGATQTITLPRPLNAWQRRRTAPQTLLEIDRLLDQQGPYEIAQCLNQQGRRTAEGKAFDAEMVAAIAKRHGLPSRYDRLRAKGLLTIHEMAKRLKVSESMVWRWRKKGILQGQPYGINKYLYHPIPSIALGHQSDHKVQYET